MGACTSRDCTVGANSAIIIRTRRQRITKKLLLKSGFPTKTTNHRIEDDGRSDCAVVATAVANEEETITFSTPDSRLHKKKNKKTSKHQHNSSTNNNNKASKLALTNTQSPSSVSTVPETDDEPSPCSALYFASPLTTAILEEDERDPNMPSDEEDSVYLTNVDVPMDESQGTLLRKIKTAGSGFSTALPWSKMDEPSLPADSKHAVSDDALAHFNQLKLHARILKKSKKKQHKQAKLQERYDEDQTNRQLWAEYQELQLEVASVDSNHSRDNQSVYSNYSNHSFVEEMYFDFASVDFDKNASSSGAMMNNDGDDNGSQCSRHSKLSLLSEQSHDAQLRYFAEKKKQRKKKRHEKKHTSKMTASASASVTSLSSSCMDAGKDYGPPRYNNNNNDDLVIANSLRFMEVMVPELSLASPSKPPHHDDIGNDNASCVSDLGDESTLASNASSLNDYGVSRRRRRRGPTLVSSSRPSLKSKLDSLESAVAELRDSTNHLSEVDISQSASTMLKPIELQDSWSMRITGVHQPLEQPTTPMHSIVMESAEEPLSFSPGIADMKESEIVDSVTSLSATNNNATTIVGSALTTQETSVYDDDDDDTQASSDVMRRVVGLEPESTSNEPEADSCSLSKGSENEADKETTSADQPMVVPPTSLSTTTTTTTNKSSPLWERSSNVDSLMDHQTLKSIHSLTTEEFRLLSIGVFDAAPPSDEDSLSPSPFQYDDDNEDDELLEEEEAPPSETLLP